jgi:hypothetical protein
MLAPLILGGGDAPLLKGRKYGSKKVKKKRALMFCDKDFFTWRSVVLNPSGTLVWRGLQNSNGTFPASAESDPAPVE